MGKNRILRVCGAARKEIAAWVGSHVLPHEAAVRAWLKRWTGRHQDIDDVIQEAYCREPLCVDASAAGGRREVGPSVKVIRRALRG